MNEQEQEQVGGEAKPRFCFSCADGMTEATKVCDVPKTDGGTVEMFLCDYHAPFALIAWGAVPRALLNGDQ